MEILGIDIGGSAIKAAVVDVASGELRSERVRRDTPRPALAGPMLEAMAEIVAELDWRGAVGCGFPGVVRTGRVLTAPNLSEDWVGVDVVDRFAEATGLGLALVNDADAAGLAEMRFGAGAGRSGAVLLLTLGTGIGSALFVDGTLYPNTELGHAEVGGMEAEHRAAARVRDEQDLSWEDWSAELDRVLCYFERILNPDLFVIGGGISANHAQFMHRLSVQAELVPAEMRNDAGIVGAALAADRPADRGADRIGRGA